MKSAGKPITGVEVRVVDDHDHEVPPGQVGEMIARGPNVMKGYWNRPEVNAEVLRGGWMHTGDLGAMDEEGFLYVLDRKKDMIKTGERECLLARSGIGVMRAPGGAGSLRHRSASPRPGEKPSAR